MNGTPVKIKDVISRRQEAPKIADRSAAVQELFVELVQILASLRESGHAIEEGQSLERWEDDEYVYFQTDLPPSFDAEIDVNVHDGRVYVRMERQAREPAE